MIYPTLLVIRSTAAQEPMSFDDLTPVSSDVVMQPEYAKSIARTALLRGYPMVKMMNRQVTLTKNPEPGRSFGALPFWNIARGTDAPRRHA